MGNSRISYIILTLILLFSIVSCSRDNKSYYDKKKVNVDHNKPLSWGHQQKLYVFADDITWSRHGDDIIKTLSVTYTTTEEEEYYEVLRADINKIEQFYKFKNLIFITPLTSQDPVSKYLNESFNSDFVKSVIQKKIGLFVKKNYWANDQLISFILSDSNASIDKNLTPLLNKCFSQFKEILHKRIGQKAYGYKSDPITTKRKSNKDLPYELMLPRNFKYFRGGKNFQSYISRLRDRPDKVIGIYYEKMDEVPDMQEWMLKTRQKIGMNFYEGDSLIGSSLKLDKISANGLDMMKLNGRWENNKILVGGAVQFYGFYDGQTDTAYLIDNYVYFPQGKKLPALIELEEITKSFSLRKQETL